MNCYIPSNVEKWNHTTPTPGNINLQHMTSQRVFEIPHIQWMSLEIRLQVMGTGPSFVTYDFTDLRRMPDSFNSAQSNHCSDSGLCNSSGFCSSLLATNVPHSLGLPNDAALWYALVEYDWIVCSIIFSIHLFMAVRMHCCTLSIG